MEPGDRQRGGTDSLATRETGETEAKSHTEPEVMAAVDEGGKRRTFIVADITRDSAWISIPTSEAPVLAAWR